MQERCKVIRAQNGNGARTVQERCKFKRFYEFDGNSTTYKRCKLFFLNLHRCNRLRTSSLSVYSEQTGLWHWFHACLLDLVDTLYFRFCFLHALHNSIFTFLLFYFFGFLVFWFFTFLVFWLRDLLYLFRRYWTFKWFVDAVNEPVR